MNEEVQIMSLREQGSAHHADHTDWILPDINDPTAGQVAISGSWRLSRRG